MSDLKEADRLKKQLEKLDHKRTALLAGARPEVRELVLKALELEKRTEQSEAAE